MKSDYSTNSRYITHTIAFWKVGRIHFLSSGVKGLRQRPLNMIPCWAERPFLGNILKYHSPPPPPGGMCDTRTLRKCVTYIRDRSSTGLEALVVDVWGCPSERRQNGSWIRGRALAPVAAFAWSRSFHEELKRRWFLMKLNNPGPVRKVKLQINVKFPLQPHQTYYITQYEELGFS